MLQALATQAGGSTVPLDRTDRAELASELGMDPTLCFEHSSDDLIAVGCFQAEGGSGSIPYQIIDLSLTRR